MNQPWYATREDVKSALDFKESARNNPQVDRALAAATESVAGLCHRRFYPEFATRYFDWPVQYARPWRLWLDGNELISITSLTTGSQTLTPGTYLLRRSDFRDEPPYTRVEVDLNTSSAFIGGNIEQRDIQIVGLFGYRNDETVAGTVTAGASATATTLAVSNSAAVGVGNLLRVGTERLVVTEKTMASTGQTLQAPVGDKKNEELLTVTNGAAYSIGETLLLDAERIRIVDIAGNNLIVRRAWDGSTLAAHTGSTIYALRSLTVTRGVLGTTAATITQGDSVSRWDPPGPVRQLCIAEAISELLQERSGWFRTAPTGSGGSSVKIVTIGALIDLREQVYTSHGRKARTRAV